MKRVWTGCNGCNEQSRFEPLEDRRMFAGGTLDPTFGVAGTAKPNLGFSAIDMAVQPDGKTLALGKLNNDWVVARLDAKGALDRSFGGGDGMASVRFDKDPSPERIAIQPGGKIVVAGIRTSDSIVKGVLFLGDTEVVMARFKADGQLDAGFGSGGKLAVLGGKKFHYGLSNLAVQPDGKIVFAAGDEHVRTPIFVLVHSDANFVVARLNANGTPDTTFGQFAPFNQSKRLGFVDTDMDGNDIPSAVFVQADGKIVVGGTKDGNFDVAPIGSSDDDFGPHQFLVARYNANGTLDKSFDGNGKLATDMAGNRINDFDRLTSVVAQPDGRIIAGGFARGSFAMVRYNVNGSIDTRFLGGRVFTNLSTGGDLIHSLHLDARGNITAVGATGTNGQNGTQGTKLVAVQYLSNGTLDRSFGSSGVATLASGKINIAGAARSPGGKIVVANKESGQTTFVRFAQATPIVEMRDLANDQTAEGSLNPAAILIRRDFAYDFPTRVFLDVSGSAAEGVDYTSPALHRAPIISVPKTSGGPSGGLVPVQLQFKYFIDIPAGADFVVAEVFAKTDALHEGDENIHWAPVADVSYQLGAGNAGHVLIHDVLP